MVSKHLPSQAKIDLFHFLRYPRRLSLPHEPPSSGGIRRGWCDVPCTPSSLDHSQLLLPEVDLSSLSGPGTSQERLVVTVKNLKPLLPSGCEVLGEEDLQISGLHPVSGGGFAEVWAGQMKDGTRVAIKSQRCYSSSSCLPAFLRMYKEALMCSHLSSTGRPFVPFIAVYSTPEHPFGLVFEFMEHLDLGNYLRDNPDIPRLGLLLEIARCLEYMHGLGIVHGNIEIANILINHDGHVYIAGLGTAVAPAGTAPVVNAHWAFLGIAPELVDPQQCGFHVARPTTHDDVYAFAILAREVFAGRASFPDRGIMAGGSSMVNGRGPTRPKHPELSDRVWKAIEGCWRVDPVKRKKITKVVATFEAEVNAQGGRRGSFLC